MMNPGVTLCVTLRIPSTGLEAFRAYEDAVLPLLASHGGLLQRRLRTETETVEIHVLWFPSSAQYEAYRADPRRLAHADLLATSRATAEILTVQDIKTG